MWSLIGRYLYLQEKIIHASFVKMVQCPKAHLLHIGIESFHPLGINYKREFCDSVSIVYYNFLDQVHNLLNDISIWGDESNFQRNH